MIIHQKPYVLASRLISMGMVRGLACEKMEKPMNWVVFVEWTN
jgi:Fe2+ transport system protein FeoA